MPLLCILEIQWHWHSTESYTLFSPISPDRKSIRRKYLNPPFAILIWTEIKRKTEREITGCVFYKQHAFWGMGGGGGGQRGDVHTAKNNKRTLKHDPLLLVHCESVCQISVHLMSRPWEKIIKTNTDRNKCLILNCLAIHKMRPSA